MHQVCQTRTPMSQVQWCRSTSCLTSTPSYTNQHHCLPSSSRAVVPMPTQDNHSQLRYATATHQPHKSMSRLTTGSESAKAQAEKCSKTLASLVCLSTSCNIWHPSKRFGFLLLWYASCHGTAIKYAPAMVPHTTACGGTSVNAVWKQQTLSQVAQLQHHRLWQDPTS